MSNAVTALAEARRSWPWMVVVGIALILAGIAAVGRPLAAGVAVTIFVGWLMVFAGASHFLCALAGRGFGQMLLRLMLAVIYTTAGVWLLTSPGKGLALLTLVLGIALIVDGMATFIYAFALPYFVGKGFLFLSGMFSILVGIIIWVRWPMSSELVVGVLLGIRLLFAGASFAALGFAVKNAPDS
jgi:uncharacterized membrane protein HdeD (DUF308 family)